jgi:MFS family permease
MLYPLIPVFVSETLAAPGKALGWIEGAAEGTAAFTAGAAGLRSDRLRKRVPFVRLGYALSALSKPLLALAYAWPFVLVLRVSDRVGKGIRTAPRDALIADIVASEHRGRAYGFHRTMDTAGAVVGVLCALGLLALWGNDYRSIFAISAIPAALAVVLTFTLREPRPAVATARAPANFRALPKRFWSTAAVLWLFALGNSSDTFLLLRAKDQGFDATTVVLAYALYNVVYSAIAYPAGILSDRIGRKRVIAVGFVCYVVVYAGFAALGGAHLWWLFALYGLHMGLVQGVASALIADSAPNELKASAIGAYRMGLGFAALFASACAGYLWDDVSHAAPFWLGSGGAAAALVALPLLVRTPRARRV